MKNVNKAEDAIRAIVADLVWSPAATSYEEAKKREQRAIDRLLFIGSLIRAQAGIDIEREITAIIRQREEEAV